MAELLFQLHFLFLDLKIRLATYITFVIERNNPFTMDFKCMAVTITYFLFEYIDFSRSCIQLILYDYCSLLKIWDIKIIFMVHKRLFIDLE